MLRNYIERFTPPNGMGWHGPYRNIFKVFVAMLLTVLPTSIASPAHDQYPSRTVRIVVGFPAGTIPDTLARLLADSFRTALGQPVVVENIAGAGGNIAAERVVQAAPDGHTLLLAGNASIVVNQSLYARLSYDARKDLAPISQIATTPNVLVVNPDVPAHSVADLVKLAKERPGGLSYAHVGPGTSQHIAAEILQNAAGITMQGISYRGGAPAFADLISGRVQVCFCNIAGAAPLAKDGKLRPLAVTSEVRSSIAPDWPTMKELGYTDFSADAWFGLVAPAGTPDAVLNRLHRETSKVLNEPDVRKTITELGAIPIGNTPAEFSKIVEAESLYWAETIKRLKLKIE